LQNLIKKKIESKAIEDINFGNVKSKEDFFNSFDIYQKKDIRPEDLDIFEEFSFYPAISKNSNSIIVITNNKNLKRNLSKLEDKTPIKLLTRYTKDNKNIFLLDNTTYFEIIDQTSVIDKEYTDNEAKTFFNDLLTDANRKGASDIHITWLTDNVGIRYRVDGKIVLQPKKISKELGNALRNIFVNKSGESEYQENEVAGQITEIIDGEKKEYRVSIGPTVRGYAIVIRTESSMNNSTNLEKWGYSPDAVKIIRRLFSAHHGIILVTGATGSGKTTLLYTCIIEKMNENPKYSPEIFTVEDPVEIEVDGVNQVQVNTKGDKENWITFSKAIKMFLRQDPDMIVVGEIRDYDVAINAVTAAKTGHLTASTLHTNDVKSTFTRLNELGIDKANIEDGVKGVVSQKLLNRLCDNCKIKVEKNGQTLYERNHKGCKKCSNSSVLGCKGRVPVVEIAELTNEIDNYKPENFLDYYSLEDNLMYLLEEGIIDLEEARRYMEYNEEETIEKRKEILDIWKNTVKNPNESFIFPVFQPIIDDKDYVIGYESYMRIKNKNGEIVIPKYFMHLIKKMNMYNNFSMHILKSLIKESKFTNKRIFWNIDKENIIEENFATELLELLESNELKDRLILEFEFKTEYKDFVKFCNDNDIQISFDNFSGNIGDLIFIERYKLFANYIKTSKSFIDGIRENEAWISDYLSIISHTRSQIIVNYVETDAIKKEILNKFNGKIYGFQGYSIGRPEKMSEFLD